MSDQIDIMLADQTCRTCPNCGVSPRAARKTIGSVPGTRIDLIYAQPCLCQAMLAALRKKR